MRTRNLAGLFGLLVMLTAPSCARAGDRGCAASPVGSFRVFVEQPGAEPPPPRFSLRFSAVLSGRRESDDLGFRRLELREDDGKQRVLAYQMPTFPGLALPLEDGERYDFAIEFAAGSPDASALIVRRAGVLLFAAASDQRPGEHVLGDGIEGFTVEMLSSSCGNRDGDRCVDSSRNATVRIAHGGESAELFQGGSAALDGYRAFVLTAQEVSYRQGCADAGLVGVSYVIVRTAGR